MATTNSNSVFDSSYENTIRIPGGGCAIKWSVGSGAPKHLPLLLAGVVIQYGRQVQPLYPINANSDGTRTQIQLVGPASGTLQCTGILTPKAAEILEFLQACGATCADVDKQVNVLLYPFGVASKGCGYNTTCYRLGGLSLITTELRISAQGGMPSVTAPATFAFSDLEIVAGQVSGGSSSGSSGSTSLADQALNAVMEAS